MFNIKFRKSKEIEISSPEKDDSTIFTDIDTCINNGYSNDAVKLIEEALTRVTKNEDKLKLYFKLEQTYLAVNNNDMVMQTYKRMSEFILKEAPYLKFKVIPQSLELYKQGNYFPDPEEVKPLAELAYEKKDYATALKLISDFTKSHSNHQDINYNYMIAARCFAAKKNYEKAIKIYNNILNKLEKTDSLYFDVKSELLLVRQEAKHH